MIIEFIIGIVLLIINVCIHAVCFDNLMRALERHGHHVYRIFRRHWKIPMLIFSVLGIFFAHIIEIWVWAIFYLCVGALPDFEEALYFSTTTFTTVGYGDIVLNEGWRLTSAFQSAIGFLLFGWSTAFIFEVMTKLYKDDKFKKAG